MSKMGETRFAGVESGKRCQVESEKHGTGKYIHYLPDFPVLPDTLCLKL